MHHATEVSLAEWYRVPSCKLNAKGFMFDSDSGSLFLTAIHYLVGVMVDDNDNSRVS